MLRSECGYCDAIRSGAYRAHQTRAYREIPSWDSLLRALLFESEIRANYPDRSLLSAARSRDPRTQRRDRKGWLTTFSESAVRAVVTSQPARARAGNGGTERGAPPRAANLKAYRGERQRERAESRAERRKRRNTLERKGCVSRREPERGGHERGREKATKEGRADAWESSALRRGGAQPGTGERKSKGSGLPGYLRAPRAPLARGKFDLLATLFTGCRC